MGAAFLTRRSLGEGGSVATPLDRGTKAPPHLQPHEIEQELAPKINHPAPGIFYVTAGSLLEHALVDVVRNLIPQIVFHFELDALVIERIDRIDLHAVLAQKFTMTLVKLPERLIGRCRLIRNCGVNFKP